MVKNSYVHGLWMWERESFTDQILFGSNVEIRNRFLSMQFSLSSNFADNYFILKVQKRCACFGHGDSQVKIGKFVCETKLSMSWFGQSNASLCVLCLWSNRFECIFGGNKNNILTLIFVIFWLLIHWAR